MFQLNEKEFENLRSQFATSSWWGQRYAPYAFTEHGILMLSSVLRSAQAIQTNISIIRVFNHMRKMIDTNTKMMEKLNKIERWVLENNQEIQELRFEIKKMMSVEVDDNERTIWFRLPTQDS